MLIQYKKRRIAMKDDNSKFFKILGKNIKHIRTLKGLSQEQLAEKIGKTPHYIALIETGRCGISVPTIVDISNALKVDINVLFESLVTSTTPKNSKSVLETLDNFDKDDKKVLKALFEYIDTKHNQKL